MSKMAIVSQLDALSPAQLEWTALHPRLQQPMSVVDLFYFVAEHDDHHLARISTLIPALGAGPSNVEMGYKRKD